MSGFMFLCFGVVRALKARKNLKKTGFAFVRDATGCPFVAMTHDETTKDHPGGISVRSGELREK